MNIESRPGFKDVAEGVEDSFSLQEAQGFRLADFLQMVQVRWQIIVGTIIVVLVLTAVVTFQLTPLFTGKAVVMLDARRNNVAEIGAVVDELPANQSTIQNQIQILQSRNLQSLVIDKAGLMKDPEFNPQAGGDFFAFLKYLNPMRWFGTPVSTRTEQEQLDTTRNTITNRLLSRMTVTPIGTSLAITIAFDSTSPQKAARITNAIADAYVEDQLNAKFEATQKASKWLADRLQQLNGQVQAADAAVAQYKADKGLIESGSGGSVVDQQVAALNSQLVLARSSLAETEAKYARVSELSRQGRSADVTQVVDSGLIATLRGQETTLMQQQAEFSSKYGPRHPKVIDLQSQMANLQAKIGEEVGRVVQTVANDVAVARARVNSLQGSLSQVQGQSGVQGQDRVKLMQLQANATSTRSLYDAFLSRFKQTQDQEGVQTPDARILSRAIVPSAPSFPNKLLIFGAAIPLSIFLGLLLALTVERLDNGFRTSSQVEGTLGLPVLGTIPEIKGEKNAPVSPADWITEKPLSFFTEAIRGIQIGLTLSNVDRKPKVVLVTSSTPGEGKTTVAISLARQAARNGEKVILVDGDLRRPRVASALGITNLENGIVEALTNTVPLEQCLHKDPLSNVFFLPSATKAVNPPDLLSSAAMENLISVLSRTADLVIIDSAPLLPVNDTKVLTRLADAVLFVVRWEKTPREAAKAAVRALADVSVAIAGVVMTRTDVTRYHYYSYGYQGYYNYASYYND